MIEANLVYVEIILLTSPHTWPLVMQQFTHLKENQVKIGVFFCNLVSSSDYQLAKPHLIDIHCLLPVHLLLQGGQGSKGGRLCPSRPIGK